MDTNLSDAISKADNSISELQNLGYSENFISLQDKRKRLQLEFNCRCQRFKLYQIH